MATDHPNKPLPLWSCHIKFLVMCSVSGSHNGSACGPTIHVMFQDWL